MVFSKELRLSQYQIDQMYLGQNDNFPQENSTN